MKKRLLLLMLCPALTLGLPGRVRAQNEPEEKMGTVTIQYVDFASPGSDTKPIEGAMFSFYPIGKKKETPYATMKTDAKGVLTARLPEGEYRVRQEENEVRYRTSDFVIRIPMKNDQGVLTDEIEAVPKAEPVTESEASPTEEVTSEPGRNGHTPSPGPSKAPKKENQPGATKTKRVKTGDAGLYPAAVAAIASAAGLGVVMVISRKKQRKGDDKS